MTTQLTTNNIAGSPNSEVAGISPPAHFPDEATLSRLASEFFAALPSSGGHSSGLNLDLPNMSVRHPMRRSPLNLWQH